MSADPSAAAKLWSRVKAAALKGWSALGLWIDRQFGGPQAGGQGDALIHDFKPDAASVEEAPIPISAHSALYVVVAALLFAILWSILGTLDRIVVAQGRIVTSVPLIVMQPLTTSRIERVHVRAGEHVARGQTLISFDPAFAEADVSTLEQRLRSLEAEIARLDAELAGAGRFIADTGPEWQAQAQIFAQRRSQFAAELAVRDSRQRQVDAQIAADEESIAGLTRQLELARRVAAIRRELQARDAGSMLELMTAEKDEIDFDLRLKNTVASRDRNLHSRAEIAAERQSFLDQWRGGLNERLVAARQEASQARENLNKARRLSDLTELRAPVDAIVLEMAERSEGSVLREAETLITLVPDDARLSIEADILSRDVGFIAVGDPVRVKLEAYPFQQYGTLAGQLETVSPDSVPARENDRNNVVFHAQIQLDETAGDAAGRGIRLRPGLVATAEIKAGERSIISYVLDPVMRIRDEGMREP